MPLVKYYSPITLNNTPMILNGDMFSDITSKFRKAHSSQSLPTALYTLSGNSQFFPTLPLLSNDFFS